MSALVLEDLVHLRPMVMRMVGGDDIDLNGHMNSARYFSAQVAACRAALSEVGVSEAYVATRRMGTFAIEHHVRYLDELRHGQRLDVRVRFVGRSPKAVHLQGFLGSPDVGVVNVLEVISVHVDLDSRRPRPFPDDISSQIDAAVAEGGRLDGQVPLRLSLRH